RPSHLRDNYQGICWWRHEGAASIRCRPARTLIVSHHIAPAERRLFVGALLAAFVLEALILFVALPRLESGMTASYGVGFADDYDKLAASILTGHGYRIASDLPETMMREPGYPLFLAGVFRAFGENLSAARVANFALTFGVCW